VVKRVWGEEYRITTVCIDSYENGILSGRIQNPYLKTGTGFRSTIQFLKEMENVLDAMEFPKSFTETRTLTESPELPTGPPEPLQKRGGKATFILRILFRQNASWQGSITWLEGRREQSFRSALELIFLIDSAVCPIAS